MPTAIVTGATGFIGGHLCRRLASEGWKVHAVHRRSSSEGLIRQLRSLKVDPVVVDSPAELRDFASTVRPDVAFHLATHYVIDYSAADVSRLLTANIELGTYLLEGLVGTDCVFINATSYFQFHAGVAVPHSLYTATKQAFSDIAAFYRQKRGVDVRNVVLYDSFGPDDSRPKLVPQLLNAVNGGLPISLGPANQALNLLYVEDIVAGLIAASESRNPESMALSAINVTSLAEIVGELESLSHTIIDKKFDNSRPLSDIAERAGYWPPPLNWKPKWTLAEGLAATIASRGPIPSGDEATRV